ncbi:Arginine biosynthesis bifunctional protein ArgJ [Penicillium subrubescens]|nr:Arginine biosynthesis bifunctional protein ArgJ [Penicillium subrubescens]KAJ5906809.1 Arginine biosynthesis bifunctional protein ArgJ [Penicillium subrubescens]
MVSNTQPATMAVSSFARMLKGQVRCYSAPLDMAIPASKQRYIPTSGTYPKGFKVSGTHIGVKASNTRFPDLALIASETPCSAAAVFTTNKFQAAPVQVSRQTLKSRKGEGIRAVVINSGCANAVTGKGGLEDAVQMGQTVDECSGAEKNSSLVMSTGVIGQRLPIKKILDRIPTAHANLDSTHDAWLSTARAICTTDTFPKLLSRTFTLPSSPGHTYSLAGMTKGAGMIHPNMATLLGVLCTDAAVEPAALQSILKHSISRSFNSISIDGDTSTNDTIAVLANGAAGGETVRAPASASEASADYQALQTIFTDFAQELSQLVVRDGEGATKFVTVRIRNSPDYESARLIASTIARSPLVKTALYGRDANWGRILCAVGYTQGVKDGVVVPERTSVSFRPVDGSPILKLLVNGEPEAVDEERASVILQNEDLEIEVDLGGGEKGAAGCGGEDAVYWFCDFSHEYVTINGDYRT